ncbi:MAG: hypothetical protein DRN71_02015 [Candidatus Nanohalarchaeota archaeon]|nr:MAG: hypothetical protein DRN71_02015 [Candidatus Nanohaloarchaeota archaeon]
MYEKVNITETHLGVLTLFTKGYNKEYYIREVHKLLKISPRTAQLILDNLEKKTVLESRTRGKIRLYKLKNTMIAKEYISLTEQYKKISFLKKNHLTREIIEKTTPCIKGIGIIFGSYAKGIQKKDSDLDIFIAGHYDKDKIAHISKLYGTDISIKNYPDNLFRKNIKKDVLLKEVLENHIIICGCEKFIDAVCPW